MTDKELRKLSRLELLELLLEASRENEKLKEKIEKLKIENATAHSIENLSLATGQIESALKYANSLTDTLKDRSGGAIPHDTYYRNYTSQVRSSSSDRELYWRIMGFYSKNGEALGMLPEEIRNDVTERIEKIVSRIRTKE